MKMITALLVATLAISANADKCGNAQGKTGGDCDNAGKTTQLLCVPAEKCKLDGTCKGKVTDDDATCSAKAATTEACTPAALCQWITALNKKCGTPGPDYLAKGDKTAESPCTDIYAASCDAECFVAKGKCAAPGAGEAFIPGKSTATVCAAVTCTEPECHEAKGKCAAPGSTEVFAAGKSTDTVCALGLCTDAECHVAKAKCDAHPTNNKQYEVVLAKDSYCAGATCGTEECYKILGKCKPKDGTDNACVFATQTLCEAQTDKCVWKTAVNTACGDPPANKVAAAGKSATSKCSNVFDTACDSECFADPAKCTAAPTNDGKEYETVKAAGVNCAGVVCGDEECYHVHVEHGHCGVEPEGKQFKVNVTKATACAGVNCTAAECFVDKAGACVDPAKVHSSDNGNVNATVESYTCATATKEVCKKDFVSTGCKCRCKQFVAATGTADSASSKTAPALFALGSLLLSILI